MSATSIPAFHVSDTGKAAGSGDVFIQSRKSVGLSGIFSTRLDVHFFPPDKYPSGSLVIKVALTDSVKGAFTATSIELINSYGRPANAPPPRGNPTIFLTGRCDVQLDTVEIPGHVPTGCRYWLMIASNKELKEEGTPDIVGFAIHDQTGARIAYGTGPVSSPGNFDIDPGP